MPRRTIIKWPRCASRLSLNRAVGCLLGQVIGESLGSLVEFRSKRDTNAAICGALLGASQGSPPIPVRWTMAVLACRPLGEAGAKRPRAARYWPDDVALLAEALLMRARQSR